MEIGFIRQPLPFSKQYLLLGVALHLSKEVQTQVQTDASQDGFGMEQEHNLEIALVTPQVRDVVSTLQEEFVVEAVKPHVRR